MKKTKEEIREEFPSWVWGRIIDPIPYDIFIATNNKGDFFTIKVTPLGEFEVSPFLENNFP